jgi:hypothetical protein
VARSFFCFFLQAFSALESFCARVNGFDLDFTACPSEGGAKLPTPANVTLDGVAKIGGADGTP